MKRTKRRIKVAISFLLAFCMLFSICSLGGSFAVLAIIPENISSDDLTEAEKIELNTYKASINDFVKPVFGERQISSCEYIYNLDDSADYIYVEFESGGYVVYAKETMEMLEYSLQGSLPYDETDAKKYYAGPTNYLQKQNDQFCNMLSGEKITLSQAEIQTFSQQARESVINQVATKYEAETIDFSLSTNKTNIAGQAMEKSSAPSIDLKNPIVLSDPSKDNIIENYQFFLADPIIGENGETLVGNGNKGTCGPIAAQLLLGYVNYFHDRRIIPNKFLRGADANGNVPERNYEMNPNTCSDPMLMTSHTTGTKSSGTGEDSFYFEMISRIMEPNSQGSSTDEVYNGINAYLSTRLSSNQYVLYYEELENGSVDPMHIKAEIKAGRPLILGIYDYSAEYGHFVVGYGYQDYNYPDNSGTYDGYIVHYGYSTKTCVWINSAWCDSYITLKSNHTHYYTAIGTIPGTNRIEYFCYTCGHRTDAAICMSLAEHYAESVVTLGKNEHKDYYLCFKGEGVKLIQTLGETNTKLELYDAEYNIIAASDNEGFNNNALISYYLFANTGYILRVITTQNNPSSNTIKIAIIPAYGVSAANSYITNFEDIYPVADYLDYTLSSFAQENYVRVITFNPRITNYYNITIESDFDTYLYVIDPYSTNLIVEGVDYDDDSGEGLNPLLCSYLCSDTPYLIIYSGYNPASAEDTGDLTIKISLNRT